MDIGTEQDFLALDGKTCDCPITHVHQKRHGALGRGIRVRVCCMARVVEEHFGLEPGTLFQVYDFEPSWEWDCKKAICKEYTHPDGSVSVIESTLGEPPNWLRVRMAEKGIPILNDPKENAHGEHSRDVRPVDGAAPSRA
jgi:hypothetical protein